MRVGGVAPAFLTPASGPGSSTSLTSFQRFSQYRLANARLLDLRSNVLDALRVVRRSPLSETVAQPVTITGASMGLDLVGTRTAIASTDEANADATSIADRQPEWATSSPVVTLDGTYSGPDATLTFEARSKTDEVGGDKSLKIRVSGGGGGQPDLEVGSGYTPGDPITLANGMTIRVFDGTLEKGDTFTVDVSGTTGSAVVRDKPFNGIGDDDAVLEGSLEVTDGSFTINGTDVITYSETDTLDDVIDRINAGGHGVTASYDEATERLTIRDDDIGPDALTLSNDTGGFLAAFKLDGATATLGLDPDDVRPIDQVSAFSSVTSGTITVNGAEVAVDVGADSLQDVIAAIDGVPDIQAALVDGKLVITGEPGETITLADTTGLLAVAGISVGATQPPDSGPGLPLPVARDLAAAVRDIARSLDTLLTDQLPGPSAASRITRLRSAIATEFRAVFDEEGDAFRAIGMTFDFSTSRTRGVGHSASSERRLAALLDEGDEDTITALLGDGDDEPGLLERLDELTKANLASFRDTLGSRVDVRA